MKPSESHNWAAHMFPISPVDWSWSGTVSGFDPGVLLESWGRVAPSCPGTITTALVFGGTGRDFSCVGAGGLAADGGDPSRACPSTISRELARNGNRVGCRADHAHRQRYSEPDVAKPSKLAEHRGWVGLLRGNSRIGGQPWRQWTNPMPSRSARLRCPVWPVWRRIRPGQKEDTLIDLLRQDGKLFLAAGWCPPVDGRGMTDPVRGR